MRCSITNSGIQAEGRGGLRFDGQYVKAAPTTSPDAVATLAGVQITKYFNNYPASETEQMQGGSVGFDIPSWASSFILRIGDLEAEGTTNLVLLLTDDPETSTTYTGTCTRLTSSAWTNTAWSTQATAVLAVGTYNMSGTIYGYLGESNQWFLSGDMGSGSAVGMAWMCGTASCSNTLTRLTITTSTGLDIFFSGTASITFRG